MIVGIGVDVVDLDRFAAVIERTPTMKGRLFTTGEQAYAESASAPNRQIERYAARFAAKEATLKALGLGVGACKWRHIEVVRAAGGAPSLVLHGGAAALAEAAGVRRWHLSLTHGDRAAIAFTTAEA